MGSIAHAVVPVRVIMGINFDLICQSGQIEISSTQNIPIEIRWMMRAEVEKTRVDVRG